MLKFAFALIFFLRTNHHVLSLQITRSKEGDTVPGFTCEGGTLIFRDDATHSLYCAKTLQEAGCYLRFSDSQNIKCVEKTGLNEYHVVPATGDRFCKDGYEINTDSILLQNYPDNIKTSVWYNGQGIDQVKNSFQYISIDNIKISFRVLEYWPGFVIKLNFVCKNSTGHKDAESRDDYCIILKNVGFTPYPLEEHTFIPATVSTTQATTNPTLPTLSTNNSNNNNNRTSSYDSLVSIQNEEILFAVVVALGAAFLIISILSTICCIVRMKRTRGVPKHGRGNPGYIEEGTESTLAENDDIDAGGKQQTVTGNSQKLTTKKPTKAGGFVELGVGVGKRKRKKKNEKTNDEHVDPKEIVTIRHDEKQVKEKAFRMKKRIKKSKSPQKPTLQFSPIISTDSRRKITNSQPNIIEAVAESGISIPESTRTSNNDDFVNSVDITVPEDVLEYDGYHSPEFVGKFIGDILNQYATQENTVLNDKSYDDNFYQQDHLYAKVSDEPQGKSVRDSRLNSINHKESFTGNSSDGHDLNADETEIENMYARVFNHKATPGVNRKLSESTMRSDIEDDHPYEQVPEPPGHTTGRGSKYKGSWQHNESDVEPSSNYTDHDPTESPVKSAMSFWKTKTKSSSNNTSSVKSFKKSPKSSWKDKDSNTSISSKNSRKMNKNNVKGKNNTFERWRQSDYQDNAYSIDTTPATEQSSPQKSVRDVWEERANSAQGDTLERQHYHPQQKSHVLTKLPANEFAEQSIRLQKKHDLISSDVTLENTADLSESIEAMFDLTAEMNDTEEENQKQYDKSFVDTLRKQMMY